MLPLPLAGEGWGRSNAGYTVLDRRTTWHFNGCTVSAAVLQVDLPFAAGVPEPKTYALMFGGLGLVGFVARRCKG